MTLRGSCLCGAVRYELTEAPVWAHNCHCSRCRKTRGAAFSSNLFFTIDALRYTRGGEFLRTFKPPTAERFTHVFCSRCGSTLPSRIEAVGLVGVPMGGVDDDPGGGPLAHIFVESKAPWFMITDHLPQHSEGLDSPVRGESGRATVRHRVGINAPVAKVYAALATADAISSWWDKQTAVQTDRGLVLEHNPGRAHGVVQLRVVAQVPNKRVEWECISTHPKTSPASAWTGTHFIFELTESGDPAHGTTLDFRQTDYDERSEFFGSNNFAWAQVLLSLKQVVEASPN